MTPAVEAVGGACELNSILAGDDVLVDDDMAEKPLK